MTPAQELGKQIYLEIYDILRTNSAKPHETSQRLAIKCIDRLLTAPILSNDKAAEAKTQILNMP